ncbi:MAG: hypothetical protein M3R70_07090 [Actinomycetota bacterium]|nr:hypothetical protein [Actinomycetota bacterium]
MIRAAVATAVGAAFFAPSAAAPARLGVVAREFRFQLSRPAVKAGPAIVELSNFGEDVHDLQLRRVGGSRTFSIPETKSHGRATLEVRLRPGTYRLWCSVADHRARGMQARFRVRR